jgi:hypothetical protein
MEILESSLPVVLKEEEERKRDTEGERGRSSKRWKDFFLWGGT